MIEMCKIVDKENHIPVDEWDTEANPITDQDRIFRNIRGEIILPIAEFFYNGDPEKSSLNYFAMNTKRSYNSDETREHICRYLNYFEKFYDSDKELLMILYRIKLNIDYMRSYEIGHFMDDVNRYIIRNSQLTYKVRHFVDDNYLMKLSSNNNKTPNLQFNNDHAKVLYEISLLMNMYIPLATHYMYIHGIKFSDEIILKMINNYTKEAGVRELDRCINKIIRKVVTSHIKSSRKIVSIRIRKNDLIQYLGKPLYLFSDNDDCIYPGVVKAVACSSIGGISLNVEVSSFKGNGKVMYTGSLSELVKESIDVSISYIKSNYKYFKIDEDYFNSHDIHIHFTQNSSNKDGTSAGVCITTAILSLIKNKIIDFSISMTGEITLKGKIIKVNGIKDKSIACVKNNISKLFIPNDNMGDISFIDSDLTNNINYIGVSDYKEIFEMLFD